jgi:SlyX protein
MNARLDELEAKLALTEDLVDSLNLTVYRQQEQIDRLQAQLRLLHARLDQFATADPGPPADQRPPHY